MSEAPKPLEVIVFGNTAVGKTSLLSSMYMQMGEMGVDSCNGMTFQPKENEEFNLLRNKWIDLRKSIRDNDIISKPVLKYTGTASFSNNIFSFTTQQRYLYINFVDTKGAATGKSDSELIKHVNESLLTICVVDAAILMECDEIDNEELNSPSAIKRILSQVLEDGDDKKPFGCMFVLTKCEKYMHDPDSRERMARRFEAIFQPVLNYAHEKRFNVFYLPVQTIGCVEFSRIDPISKKMIFKTVSKDFKPVDVIFPLVFLLKSLLIFFHISQKGRPWWEKLISWFMGWDEDLGKYYSSLMKKVGTPVDFRGNQYGTKSSLEKMSFWE